MFIFLIAYRARHIQPFRREQLITLINNINEYFTKSQIEYRIIICEQNDDGKFNKGLLLNAAFLESEQLFDAPKKYFHMNVDYTFDVNWEFPSELLSFEKGFIDLHRPDENLLGGACVFDYESYKQTNGFPNDIAGWGGEDIAIYNRIHQKTIPIYYLRGISCAGFIKEDHINKLYTDMSNNIKNMELAKRDDIETNGLTTCVYKIKDVGEFHNGLNIFHYLVDIQGIVS